MTENGAGHEADEVGQPATLHDPRDARKFARGSLLLAVGKVIAALVGIGIQIAIVRLLSKDDYGALMWALAVGSLAQSFVALGLDRVAGHLMARADEDGDAGRVVGVLGLYFGTVVGVGLLAMLATILAQSWFASLAPSQLAARLLPAVMVLVVFQALGIAVQALFAAYSQSRSLLLRSYILDPVLRLSAIAAAWILGAQAGGLLLGFILASVVGLLVALHQGIVLLRSRGVLDGAKGNVRLDVLPTLRYAIPQLLGNLTWVASNSLPVFLLGVWSTPADVATFRAVLPLSSAADTISEGFRLLLLPLGSRLWLLGRHAEFAVTFWRSTMLMSAIGTPILYLATAFSSTTVTSLFGDDYSSSSLVFTIMAWGTWLPAALGPNRMILIASQNTRVLAWTNALRVLIIVGLLVALLRPFGAMGAAAALAIGNLLGAVIVVISIRLLKLPFPGMDRYVVLTSARLLVPLVPLLIISWLFHPAFPIALLATGLATVLVLIWVAPSIGIAQSYPEVRKIPLVGPLLGRRAKGWFAQSPYA